MLLAARLLVPAEAAVLGDTLWIAQLWMAAVILWGWDAYRRADYRLRLGAIDLAVWTVAAGHLISTCYVLQGHGDARAALNLMWEWIALAFSFFLIRQTLRTRQDGGRMVLMFLALAVMLAGFGLWQHYVELPSISGNFYRIERELGQLSGPNAAREAAQLERELADMGWPANPGSQSLWESRIKSSEPFATFALANTLAGFLAAWLFVMLDWVWRSAVRPEGGFRLSWGVVGKFASVLILAYCLVLTKSRTAWVGVVLGFFTWGILRGAGLFKFSRRWFLAGAGLVLVVAGFFLIARLSGGFDRLVISEAPKSFEYRLQYWTGAWDVVQHHPWLGTGPGNFRQHYLHYKRPASSEEIADPHNWVLDLWASGGLLALLGFAAVLILAVRAAWRARGIKDEALGSELAIRGISAWEFGAGFSFFLVLLAGWFSAEPFDARLIGLLAGWTGAWLILRGKPLLSHSWAGVIAGGVALLVHLLGAGGIEMPAIVQTLFLLVILLEGTSWERTPAHSPSIQVSPKRVVILGGLALAGFVLCWLTATRPVWYRTLSVRSGDVELTQDYNPKAAARWYEEAHEADPYSPEPLERLADLQFQLWQRSDADRDFEQAVDFLREAIPLDPASHRIYGQLGRMYFAGKAAVFLGGCKTRRGILHRSDGPLSQFGLVAGRVGLGVSSSGPIGRSSPRSQSSVGTQSNQPDSRAR